MSRQSGSQFAGTCKFWNAVKGFGFLTADDGGPDLFVSQHDLVTGDARFRALTAGQRVECTYTVGEEGKAIGKNITGAGGAVLRSFKDMYTAKRQIESAKPPDPNKKYGSIKWFNGPKSFGFIVPQGGGDDLFFHFSECLKSIEPAEGDQVEYSEKEDKHGKIVGATIKNKTQKKSKGVMNPPVAGVAVPGNPYAAAPGFAAAAYPPAAFASAYGRKTGVVKFFDEGKGYGFIIPDHGGRDIHVHKSSVMGGELAKDEAVEYEEQNLNGKVQATAVSRATTAKRGQADPTNGAYSAAKRPRVVYDMPQAGNPQAAYANEYQYFDAGAMAAGAPRYYQ